MYVRRRRFTRKMVVDPDPPSKALPYELTIKVRKANVQGLGLITHSYIEVFLDHTFLDRTSAGSPDWNHKLTKKIMEIDPEMTITFVLYTKKTFTVVNPFQSGQAPIEMIHRGTAHIIIQDFLQNLTLLNKEEEIDLISPTGVKCGTLLIRLDMLETKLFSVVSAVEDSMEQLEKRTEEALPTDIRYDISSLDNDDNCFLKVLVKNVIEGRDVMTEADLVDIVSEAGYLQNVDTDQFDERNGKPKTHKQTMRYPSGKPRYSKVITLPSTMVDRNNVSIIRSQLTRALVKEEELQAINERFDDSLPAVSSIFEPQTLGVNGYDLAYQPSQQDSAKSEYYDLAIYCLPEDGVDSDVAHMLRWTSYYDYVMMIREMVKIQHQYYRDEAVNDVVRHTCKVLYGAAVGKNPQPTNWIPVSFTVDSEAEFLVIRESRVAREDQTESFDKIISFDQVDGIVVKNTYHLSHHYALEVRVHAASSMHLRDTIANIHIESTDGRQRYTFKSEPFRKGSAPAGQPGTVTFDDSYTFMLPPSVLNPRRDQNARECLHMTFSSDENTNTDTSAVYGSMDLPLSSILPAIGSNMSDCQVIYRNKLQEYELHLRVLCINNLLWKGSAAANLFSMDFNQGEDAADPYYAVYFADENGQIIPLREGGGAAAVVQDLASNLVYLSTAGMVGNKSEGGASVVGNVARDLMYLGTAGMVGGKGDGKKPLLSHHQQSMQEEGGHHSAGSSLGSVANNLVYLSTAGTFGKAKDPLKSNSAHGTPGKAQGGGLLSSLSNHGNRSTSDLQRATSKTSSDNGAAGRRPQLDRRNSANVGNPASMVGSAASGLISLGAAGIQGTSNVIVGTSNVAVNVLTLGNAGIVSSMNKADAIFISPVVNKSLNPTWDDEIVISTEQYGDLMRQAKYLLIEVWNKNTAFADECLGEVYVPIVCAHRVEPQSNLDRVPRTTGMKKYPVQLSKHMKINRTAAKRLPNGLGSMRTQLLHREIRPPRGATSKELGEDDPIKVNLLVQMKPVGALDYAWPSRVISSEATADTMESDTLFVRLKHDGLHLSVSLPTQLPYSDRIKMLLECREKSKATTSGGDKNCLVMIVPYDQLFISTCAILTTDALQCSVTLTRLVTSSTQKGKELERPVTLDLLIGPCPACDVYSILQQRVSLTEYRAPLKAIAGIQVPIDKVNDIARDLQQEILAVSHDLEDMSVRTNATPVLENILNNNSGTNTTNTTTTSKTTESNIIFADQISRMSVTYFCTKLHARVLMVQKAFLKTYLWYTLEFSNFSVAKIVGKTILPNFDKEIDIDYITILTKRARSMLKYGDYNKLSDGTDSDDSSDDENNEKIQKRKEKKNISTTSIVTRIKTIMVELSKDVHNILFQGYRRKYTPAYVQFLCSKLIYEQYLVIVGYLANILLEHSEQAAIPTGNNSNNNVNDKSLTSQVLQLTSLATNVMTLGTIKINTNNNNIHLNNHTNKNTNSFDAQKKHELISFVLSQDNLFECYLHSNLFCFDYKFSCRPHLSMCLDFDVLITKFSDLLNENIQMWNSKALKVFMCRKIEEGVAPSRLPWDITTLKDDQSNNDLYISHIPESIQIQLNVQIGMKKINTKGMGDNLSIMSIKRIYDINLRIAKAIARAYLSLAVEYDNFLEETTNALAVTEVGAGDRVKSIITNFGAKMLEVGTLGVLNVNDITTTGTTGNKDENTTQEESDELLCFLMSIVNDCRRINKEHIPQSIASFVKEFTDSNTDTLVQQQTRKRSTSSKDNSSIHGGRHNTTTSSTTPTLTATEEINNYFFNPIKAIKAVSRNAINCLTNQVFFHGDLREYFLHTFAEHMLIKTQSSTLLSLVKVVGNTAMNASSSTATLDKSSGNNGGDASPVDRENETVEIEEKDNAVSTIVATLQDMYSFTASHVGIEDQNRIIYNCLKKLIMRYLLMLRDILLIKNTSRLSSALNTGINSSINTGMMMGRTVLQLTTLGLAGGNESTDNMSGECLLFVLS